MHNWNTVGNCLLEIRTTTKFKLKQKTYEGNFEVSENMHKYWKRYKNKIVKLPNYIETKYIANDELADETNTRRLDEC